MIKSSEYNEYMQLALTLAVKGWGKVSPNPMVGAVVVKNNKIVGIGFHERAGKPHAEVVAIKDAGCDAKGATIIVNLEPCCHHGRTPPCADLIIKSGIKRVVYGMKDPNRLVVGKGLRLLKKAGIEVVGPVLEKECKALNRIFIHSIQKKTPFVISKVAMSLDGKIAAGNGNSKWITNSKCRKRVHYWRAGVDAILVGAETVRKDAPLLNARGIKGARQPRPVIVSNSGKFSPKRKIWDRKPILFCPKDSNVKSLEKRGVEVVRFDKKGSWGFILKELGKRDISSLLVEGGGQVHSQIMKKKLSDYMIATLSLKLLGSGGIGWTPDWKVKSVEEGPEIIPDQMLFLDDNIIIEGEVKYK